MSESPADAVDRLLGTVAEIRARCGRPDADAVAIMEGLTELEFRAFGLSATVATRRRDRDVQHLTRQAVTLLAGLGAETNYDFAVGAQRVVILGARSVWKLAMNADGEATSDIEARASIPAPVAPARWHTVAGIRVLEMERVEVVRPDDLSDQELRAAPWWTDVDCWNLGRRRTGELVVFDAGQFGPAHRRLLPDRYLARVFRHEAAELS